MYDGEDTPEVTFTEVGLVECDGFLNGEDSSGCKEPLAKECIVGCDGDSFGKVPLFPTLSEVAVERTGAHGGS